MTFGHPEEWNGEAGQRPRGGSSADGAFPGSLADHSLYSRVRHSRIARRVAATTSCLGTNSQAPSLMKRMLTVKRIVILLATGVVAALLLAFIAREPGTSHAEQARAEEKAVLLSLEIQGPTSVNARSAERFTLTARYSDGTAADVTDRAQWSIDSPYAAVAGGVLSVRDLPADQESTVTAWFTEGLSFKAARTVALSANEPRTERIPGPTGRGST